MRTGQDGYDWEGGKVMELECRLHFMTTRRVVTDLVVINSHQKSQSPPIQRR